MSDALKEKADYTKRLIKLLKSEKIKLVNLKEYRKLKDDLKSTRTALEAFRNGK